MDTRIKFKEVGKFIKAMKADYKSSSTDVQKKKKKTILKTIRLTFDQIWSMITAPIIYPIWYIFRKFITESVYENSNWEEVHYLINNDKVSEAKKIVKQKGKLLYWLWTYGDLKDPLGTGELPEDFYGGRYKNNFKGRYYENAIRNPRFTINYMDYLSGVIAESYTIIDTRDYGNQYSSEGLGNKPSGIMFKWFVDSHGDYYFIYDDNNKENLFYFGYTGLSREDIGKIGRFEIGYRSN